MRRPLFWKLFLGTLGLVLLAAGGVGLLLANQTRAEAMQDAERLLRARATELAYQMRPFLAAGQAEAVQQRVLGMSAQFGIRLTVLSPDGTVLADSQENPQLLRNQADQPEVRQAGVSGSGLTVRHSHGRNPHGLYLALSVRDGDRPVGYVRTSLSLAPVDARLTRLWSRVLAGAGLAALAGLVLGYRLSGEVQQREEELRRLETARREFLADASHEIKTPLTAICGLVETVRDDPDMDSATRRRFLDHAAGHTVRLSAVVMDLLALSRLDARERLTDPRPVDLGLVARESLRCFQPMADQAGVRLSGVIAAESLTVLGEEDALRQLVDNLTDNAVKYTPSGGSAELHVFADGRNAVLEVRDTGVGIAPEHLDRIFERFYRVDKSRSRELGGTGLGLAIVRKVAVVHGGAVRVESAPGRGSCFRVSLPLASS